MIQRRREILLLLTFLAGALSAAEVAPPPSYPLWDGIESVADYAKRVNLPPTQTLDLGGGVKLELVLIPAGKFIMGTPEPEPVNAEEFGNRILTGLLLTVLCGVILLVLLGIAVFQSIRDRRRPQLSLAALIILVIVAGGGVLSGMHWQQSIEAFTQSKTDYAAAKARYDSALPAEKPAHPVTLTKPCYMGRFSVTQEQYQAVIGANPSKFKGKDHPVETVSWVEAQEFCKKLTEQTGRKVRLPTDAEWEFACRAGTMTTYYSGDAETDLARVAWCVANSKRSTHPVGQKEANAFGLHDMHGNVWQWCQDFFGEDYYEKSTVENPQGPTEGTSRVLRGGSWLHPPAACRTTFRVRVDPDVRDSILGFRLVMPVSP